MVVEVGGTDALSFVQKALHVDGFAALDQAFTPESLRIVEELFDELVQRARTLDAGSRASSMIYDMLPGGQHGSSLGNEWDQLEIQHAGALQPVLLDTDVFRQCDALAKRLARGSSYSFDHFICKSPRNIAETPWHQDAAFMRFAPSRMGALHFWIPFQDAAISNGCMRFVPGSHPMPLLPHQPFAREKGPKGWRCDSVDNDEAISCPVPLGGVAIHTPYTLHQAGRNATDLPRKAWIIQFSRWGRIQHDVRRYSRRLPGPLKTAPLQPSPA